VLNCELRLGVAHIFARSKYEVCVQAKQYRGRRVLIGRLHKVLVPSHRVVDAAASCGHLAIHDVGGCCETRQNASGRTTDRRSKPRRLVVEESALRN